MVTLDADANAQNAISHLRALSSEATRILGSLRDPITTFNEYLLWSVDTMRRLRRVLDEESLRRLVETTAFRLIHATDPDAYSRAALGELVRNELSAQVEALDEAADFIRAEVDRWSFRGAITIEPVLRVGVLDSNILMMYGSKLETLDWNAPLDVRRGHPIGLVIPRVVVRELDRLKRSSGRMRIGKDVVEHRDLARRALRALNELFPGSTTSHEVRAAGTGSSSLRVLLQVDDLRHGSLPDADAEIIDRALTLRPYAASVTLLTGDTSMRFRAEHAGLHAVEPV